MKKVVIKLSENHDSILVFTAIGTNKFFDGSVSTIVTSGSFDLSKGTIISVDKYGNTHQTMDGDQE